MHCHAWFQAWNNLYCDAVGKGKRQEIPLTLRLQKGNTKMVAFTYDVTRVPTVEAAAKSARADQATPRKSWLTRFFDAMVEARLAQAERQIRMHMHLLPSTLDERGNRLVKTRSGDMPFGGW
jgi:hypothetical protein